MIRFRVFLAASAVIAATVLSLAAACTAPAAAPIPATSPGEPLGRAIIRFKVRPAGPGSDLFLAELGRDCGCRIQWSHALTEDTHVYLLSGPATVGTLAEALKNIQKRDDVAYAEPDARVRAQ